MSPCSIGKHKKKETKFWKGEGILEMSAKELKEYSLAVSDKYSAAFKGGLNIKSLISPKKEGTDNE